MDTHITARHFRLTEAQRSFIEQRLDKLNRFYDGITTANVTMTTSHAVTPEAEAEVTINVYRRTIAASATASSIEEAVAGALKSVRKQLVRYKEKLRNPR